MKILTRHMMNSIESYVMCSTFDRFSGFLFAPYYTNGSPNTQSNNITIHYVSFRLVFLFPVRLLFIIGQILKAYFVTFKLFQPIITQGS